MQRRGSVISGFAALSIAALAFVPSTSAQSPETEARTFIEAMDAREPDLARTALSIEGQSADPSGEKLLVTVRNHHWRAVTAWSVGLVFGTDGGQNQRAIHTVDNYLGLFPGTPEEYTPLQPGSSRVLEYNIPENYDLSKDRFTRGDYSVVAVEVRAVVFDDGSFAGSDLRVMRGMFKRRYARAVALSKILGNLDAALYDDTVGAFLEQQLRLADQYERPPMVQYRPDDDADMTALLHKEKFVSGQQWLSALRMRLGSGMNSSSESGDLRSLIDDPRTLHRVAMDTKVVFREELDLLLSNLPDALRDGVARMSDGRARR